MTGFDEIQEDAERRQAQRRAEMQTLKDLTGKSAHEIDADLTAPDPQPNARGKDDLPTAPWRHDEWVEFEQGGFRFEGALIFDGDDSNIAIIPSDQMSDERTQAVIRAVIALPDLLAACQMAWDHISAEYNDGTPDDPRPHYGDYPALDELNDALLAVITAVVGERPV